MPHSGPTYTHLNAIFGALILTFLMAACAPTYSSTSSSSDAPALLKLEVEPDISEIYLNDDFHGVVNRWRDQTLSLAPGDYRLELRAPGHIPQRFDLQLPADQITRVRVSLEPELHHPEPEDASSSPSAEDPLQPPAPRQPSSPGLP